MILPPLNNATNGYEFGIFNELITTGATKLLNISSNLVPILTAAVGNNYEVEIIPVVDEEIIPQDYKVIAAVPLEKDTPEEIKTARQKIIEQHSEAATALDAANEEEITAEPSESEQLQKEETVCSISKKRKRVRNEKKWKCNERKRKCQAGEAYLSKRNKWVPKKSVVNQKDCLNSCKFKCSAQIPMKLREDLLASYYNLSQNEKHLYLVQVTKRISKKRLTKKGDDDNELFSRRQYSFMYYFPVKDEMIRVCKKFFLGTLGISQKPVYNAHASKDTNQVPKKDGRGKSITSARRTPQGAVDAVITHIRLFPTIESHYCRSRTKRQYLEATLSVPKMYELYLAWCAENETQPVKLSMYRRIFVTNFNYGFHIPKTDRCIKCETYKLRKSEKSLTNEEENTHQAHIAEKTAMRAQKNKDKEDGQPILIFDLENVITCPRTEIGNFFYLPKLTLYNLTAYLTTTKTVYCAIWNETQQGRSGNCLASALKSILNRVLLDNEIGPNLITWSDSCVAQNRNSFVSFAILETLRENSDLQTIVMNYSCAGHGAVQEVDSVHSQIETYMKKAEFFSPLGFIRNLKSVNKKHPYVIIQMKDMDFKNYEECTTHFDYKKVPFAKVVSLKFTQELNIVQYKTSHVEKGYTPAIILNENARRGSIRTRGGRRNSNPTIRTNIQVTPALQLIPKPLQEKKEVSKEKIAAIKKMMPSMPAVDKLFFQHLLKIT